MSFIVNEIPDTSKAFFSFKFNSFLDKPVFLTISEASLFREEKPGFLATNPNWSKTCTMSSIFLFLIAVESAEDSNL